MTECERKHCSVEERDKKLHCQWCDTVFNSVDQWRKEIEEFKKKKEK